MGVSCRIVATAGMSLFEIAPAARRFESRGALPGWWNQPQDVLDRGGHVPRLAWREIFGLERPPESADGAHSGGISRLHVVHRVAHEPGAVGRDPEAVERDHYGLGM